MRKTILHSLISSLFVLGLGATCSGCKPVLPFLEEEESFKAYKRSYSMNEVIVAESNTFKKLNSVTYPYGEYPVQTELTNQEVEAYSNFSNLTYKSVIKSSDVKNISYSPIGLYSLLNELEGASSRDELTERLNDLLGLSSSSRETFYKKVMRANSFASEENTTQLKNGAFFNSSYNYSNEYISKLTKLYCEAYQLDFSLEVSKIVEWVNKAVNSSNFIDEGFLELSKDTELFLFSTLYFKNAWANKYLLEDNMMGTFYLNDGSTVNATFMKHSYMAEKYYDYDKYISVKDYYYAGNASVTYLVPKSHEDNIFELTKDANIFLDNEDNKVANDEYSYINVNLKTPKFNLKTELNFKQSLTDLGFGDIFNSTYDSFHNAFSDPRLDEYNIYVEKMKQKNEVEFNEDGSIVKSVSMASLGKATSVGPAQDSIDVSLDQPFIYIIKDKNDTPIFVGHVDNPIIS